MILADYLLTANGFGDLLDQLASPTPDPHLVGDGALRDASALKILAAIRRGRSPVAVEDEPPQVLVRFVATLVAIHIDRVRSRYKPNVLGGALLFVARHLWPAYEVWVEGHHPLPARLSLPGCIGWLRDEGSVLRMLRELAVPDPGAQGLCQCLSRFIRSGAGYYGWYKSGRAALHAMVVQELNGLLDGEMVLRIEDRRPLRSAKHESRVQGVRKGHGSPGWSATSRADSSLGHAPTPAKDP